MFKYFVCVCVRVCHVLSPTRDYALSVVMCFVLYVPIGIPLHIWITQDFGLLWITSH